MKNKLFASVPNILFGALITIAPQTFAHACTGHDMPGAATTRSRRPPASGASSSCSASWLCSRPADSHRPQYRRRSRRPATTRRTHLSDRHLQGRDDALSHGYAAHAHRARRAHHRVRGHRHLARLSRRQAQLIEQTAGAQPFRTLDSRPRLLQPHYKQHKDSSCHPISHCAAFRLKTSNASRSAPAHCSPSHHPRADILRRHHADHEPQHWHDQYGKAPGRRPHGRAAKHRAEGRALLTNGNPSTSISPRHRRRGHAGRRHRTGHRTDLYIIAGRRLLCRKAADHRLRPGH